MKKTLKILVVSILVCSFQLTAMTSCGQDAPAPVTAQTSAEAESTTAEDELSDGISDTDF